MADSRHQAAGWSLGGVDALGRWPFARGDDAIRQSLWNILLTTPGERLQRPEFGAGLRSYIHQPNNETTRRMLATAVERAVKRWEKRIDLEEVSITAAEDDPTRVDLLIGYRIRATGETGGLNFSLEIAG